jgi:hypothetical protein
MLTELIKMHIPINYPVYIVLQNQDQNTLKRINVTSTNYYSNYAAQYNSPFKRIAKIIVGGLELL